MNKRYTAFLFFLIFVFNTKHVLLAQDSESVQVEKDLTYHLQIPDLSALSSSFLHLYALSNTEGLIVFRSHPDSLQWLFTLSDVQERGYRLKSDLRFAYLFSDSSKIHIIEPTSLLGIYSVTDVGFPVADLARVNEFLYVIGKNGEFSKVNVIHPDSAATSVQQVTFPYFANEKVKAIASNHQQLFFLTQSDTLYINELSNDEWKLTSKKAIPQQVTQLFFDSKRLFMSSSTGELLEFCATDSVSKKIARFQEPLIKVQLWDSTKVIVKTKSGLVFVKTDQDLLLISKGTDAGNLFTVTKNKVWFSEFKDVYRLKLVQKPKSDVVNTASANWKLVQPADVIVPFPKPVLIHIDTEPSSMKNSLLFSIKSNITTFEQYGNNFIWQPTARDIGTHIFTVIASDVYGKRDSVTFTADIKAFNQPPRFAPFRPLSIPVNVDYAIQFTAFDPDGSNRNLIRYVGLDMPQGAFLNEKTGEFTWKPTLQQIGSHQFRVIATDQYGTAASLDVSFTVLDIRRD